MSQDLQDAINRLNDRLENIEKANDQIQKTLAKLDYTIRGNGTPGLTTRITLLESRQQQKTQTINVIISIVAAIAAMIAAMQ